MGTSDAPQKGLTDLIGLGETVRLLFQILGDHRRSRSC